MTKMNFNTPLHTIKIKYSNEDLVLHIFLFMLYLRNVESGVQVERFLSVAPVVRYCFVFQPTFTHL